MKLPNNLASRSSVPTTHKDVNAWEKDKYKVLKVSTAGTGKEFAPKVLLLGISSISFSVSCLLGYFSYYHELALEK